MNKILCSTGAIITRANGRDHRLLKEFAPKLLFDGFELMIYSSWYDRLSEIASEIQSFGLCIPAVHCEKSIGELISGGESLAFSRFEMNCSAAAEVGAEKLVLHLWNGIVSDSNFDANMRAYERLAKIAERYSVMLTVENVVCNHGSPLSHLYELSQRYPEIAFTFDTKMAEFHGELQRSYDRELWKKHIRHLHVNDYGGGVMDWSNLRTLHLGEGHIDLDGFFRFVKETVYEGDMTVEASSVDMNGLVDFDKLNSDMLKIKGYIAKNPNYA